MFKKLSVVAVSTLCVAAAAQAQTQPELYGRINATIDSTRTGTVTTHSMVNDISHIGVRIGEDLGNGLKARAVIETAIGSQDPTASADTKLGDRQSTVGIAHKYGSVDFGRQVHSHFVTMSSNDPFATLYGSVAGDVHNLRGLRMSNGTFFTVTAVPNARFSFDRSYTAAGSEAQSWSASTTLGPINASLSRWAQGVETSLMAGVNGSWRDTTVFYTWSDNKSLTVGETKKGNMLGVTQKFGAYLAKASYGKTNTDVNAWNLGVDYNLSKRTSVGINYRNVDKIGTAADVKQWGVGLTHLF